MKRYEKILQLIDIFQPQSIVEIGTWNGQNACRMLTVAGNYHDKPYYIGYDLFEEATAETDKEEFNVKPHNTVASVEGTIKKACPFAEVALIKGNTRKTLRPVIGDFVFIDGGHSVETIIHDYEALKRSSVIVFDDYYTPDESGRCPDINTMGCNRIVEKLPHAIIETQDRVQGGGFSNLAVVFGCTE